MNPMTKTFIYAGLAVVSVSLAVWRGLPAPEINPQDFADVGSDFFPEFDNPNEATGIRVVVFNADTADVKSFQVSQQDGQWKIPSHYSYPADGKEQLVKTAGSLVAVKRGVVAGESEADFERLGVIDPLSEDRSNARGRGERLTLSKGSETLLDLIVGKKVDGQNGMYYVRRPDEKLTYIAELDLELSTKFGDWIEPDLLQLNADSVRDILIKDYSVNEQSRRIEFKDIVELQRDDAAAPWQLKGLDAEKEELKEDVISNIVNSARDLKIIGVRPKPAGLSADLKSSGSLSMDRNSLIDMQSKGYYMVPSQDGGAELFANEGDQAIVTDEGVVYVLRFGEVFLGNEFDIEVGSVTSPAEGQAEQQAEDEKKQQAQDLKQSRYLFVTVQFDEEALGPEPVKPTPPSEAKAEAKSETSDQPAAEGEKPAQPAEAVSAENAAEKTEASESTGSEEKKPEADPQKVYEEALKRYELDLADYQKRLEAGQKRVAELNERFADWFYVIDAASFDQLRKTRADLVGEKAKPEMPEEAETNSESAQPGSASEKASPPQMDAPAAAKPEAAEKPEAGGKVEEKAETKPSAAPSAAEGGKPAEPEKPQAPAAAAEESKAAPTPPADSAPQPAESATSENSAN